MAFTAAAKSVMPHLSQRLPNRQTLPLLRSRGSFEAPQRHDLRRGPGGSGEGGVGVKVQCQRGAGRLHTAVPLERRHSPERRPRLPVDHRGHGKNCTSSEGCLY